MARLERNPSGMAAEQVYARILARVEGEALRDTCHGAAQRDATLLERRIRGAQRALQHAYDVEAARRRMLLAMPSTINPAMETAATAALVKDLSALQKAIARRMKQLAALVASEADAKRSEERESTGETMVKTLTVHVAPQPEPEEPTPEQEPTDRIYKLEEEEQEDEVLYSPVQWKGKRRRLRQHSVDSPRKPPRPGRVAVVDDESTEEETDEAFPSPTRQIQFAREPRGGPHAMPSTTNDEATEDDLPMELDVLDSDTEFEMASYLEKARRLRKISSERRMGELPGLIKAVLAEINRHDWKSMPRELLGTLSATLGASTTLKPTQRAQLQAELLALRAVAARIDETTGRQYPTLLGSTARFLSSMDDIVEHTDTAVTTMQEDPEQDSLEAVRSVQIEELYAATNELAQREDAELFAMERMDELLTLVDHVFDNPTLARSRRYGATVRGSLDVLIALVGAAPRTTRRSLQCLETLQRRRAQLTGLDV